jgi:hypothetical protein
MYLTKSAKTHHNGLWANSCRNSQPLQDPIWTNPPWGFIGVFVNVICILVPLAFDVGQWAPWLSVVGWVAGILAVYYFVRNRPRSRRILPVGIGGLLLGFVMLGLGYRAVVRSRPAPPPLPTAQQPTHSERPVVTGPATASGPGSVANTGTIGTLNVGKEDKSTAKK